MPFLLTYILKLSLSLLIIYLFYQFLLRRLTFYNHNRWYLVGYSFLSFLIPLINITPVLERNEWTNAKPLTWVPSFQVYTTGIESATNCPVPIGLGNWEKWDWIMLGIGCGVLWLLVRVLLQYFSYRNILRHAQLVSDGDIKVYQVNKSIIPFSFGNSIFINYRQHVEAELKEIIRHEFVHVRQKHTIDILWGELICVFNWYNPAAWLIRNAIRQNLEFIADDKVIQSGMDRKQYQYLLLKVIGNNHFSIANNFNFSSLKKRIAMMNKIKTSRIHLMKFLFIFPLLTVLLLSFRDKLTLPVSSSVVEVKKSVEQQQEIVREQVSPVFTNKIVSQHSIPEDTLKPNSKGYLIEIIDNKGNCTIVVKDKNKREIKRLLLTEWDKKEDYYEGLYGEIPPPPKVVQVSPVPPVPPSPPQVVEERVEVVEAKDVKEIEKVDIKIVVPAAPAAPPVPEVIELPANVSSINVNNNKAKVTLKDGTVENYDLNNALEKAQFEKKYGKLPVVPVPAKPVKTRSTSLNDFLRHAEVEC